jgi:drug/metabolite transporter (DMT)-like permease
MNKCIRNIDPYLKTILQLASASVCLLPYLAVTGQLSYVKLDSFSLLMLLVVGIVHTGIAYTLYFGSTDGLKAQTIALFSYIDPVSALFISVLFLHEPMGAAGLVGAVLILGAAFAAER